MKELVLDLVICCENRISMIEELITGVFYAMATPDAGLAEIVGERTKLESSLQVLLARNCSLRRKDFNALMKRIASPEGNLRQLEDERRRISEEIKIYLGQQKESVRRLRQQLINFSYEKGDLNALEATVERIETAYQHNGRQSFASLRDFQLRLESLRTGQAEINSELQRLVGMGDALRTDDLKQLEADSAGPKGMVGSTSRRRELEKLWLVPSGAAGQATAGHD